MAEDDRFCANCGTLVHEAAHVSTPEADVPVPPPPPAESTTTLPPQGDTPPQPPKPSAAPLVAVLIPVFLVVGLFVLFGGAQMAVFTINAIPSFFTFIVILVIFIAALWLVGRMSRRGRD